MRSRLNKVFLFIIFICSGFAHAQLPKCASILFEPPEQFSLEDITYLIQDWQSPYSVPKVRYISGKIGSMKIHYDLSAQVGYKVQDKAAEARQNDYVNANPTEYQAIAEDVESWLPKGPSRFVVLRDMNTKEIVAHVRIYFAFQDANGLLISPAFAMLRERNRRLGIKMSLADEQAMNDRLFSVLPPEKRAEALATGTHHLAIPVTEISSYWVDNRLAPEKKPIALKTLHAWIDGQLPTEGVTVVHTTTPVHAAAYRLMYGIKDELIRGQGDERIFFISNEKLRQNARRRQR